MKKLKKVVMFVIFIFVLMISSNIFAGDEATKLLYQDIKINKDGSITIKEAAWLEGDYNGRLREIEYQNSSAFPFTGIYSNFTGNCDIYDGSGIKDIKIYDISQEKFTSIEDVTKSEKIYKEVDSASNGKYGVFIKEEGRNGIDFKIFCPDKKKKVICMEYTITDAVVIHNDCAELYWNVLGKDYREDVKDFKVRVHLPSEDSDVRIWTHGPLTGVNKIIDSKTLEFQDFNVDSYTAETVRIMFNKDIVPLATKKSNIDGREYILKYEASMADTANAKREKEKLKIENLASEAVLGYEESPYSLYFYRDAIEKVNKLDDNNKQKQEYLDRIQAALGKVTTEKVSRVEENPRISYYNDAIEFINMLKDDEQLKAKLSKRIEDCKIEVNKKWKESLNYELKIMTEDNYQYLSENRISDFIEDIEEGFDANAKNQYLRIVSELKEKLEEKYEIIRNRCLRIVLVSYLILIIAIIPKMIKIKKEKNTYKGKYYRDFPSEDNPYVIEYLMKKKITNLSFTATILNLIAKKIVKVEKNQQDDKDVILVLDRRNDFTPAEKQVIKALFDIVGSNNICSIKKLKQYAKQESKATKLKARIDNFNKYAEEEAEEKQYFEKQSSQVAWKIFIVIHYIVMILVTIIGVTYKIGFSLEIFIILTFITIISIISNKVIEKDKKRTSEGQLEYSKWLAHKKYLEDFGKFDDKDLPEIILWEKYLVTATILGCADKIQKRMKIYIKDTDMNIDDVLFYNNINANLIKTINSTVKTSVNTANRVIYESSSYSSSGGGFGGGSSGGGGRRWTAEAAEVVSKEERTNKYFIC